MMKKIILGFCILCLGGTASVRADGKAAGQPVKVACVGNSITYGTGIKDPRKDSYPAQLQQLLGEKYMVGNFGKPGATLLSKGHRPYVQQQEYRDALAFVPDVAVIHLGINDTDPRNWPDYRDEFVSDYLKLIESFRQVNPEVRIILARMTPIGVRHPRFLSGTRDWHRAIQALIPEIAEVARAEWIDFFAPLYPYPNLFPDALHPNEEGASLLARTVYSGITGEYGGLQVSGLYSDHMVLPCGRELTLSGTADAGDRITVSLSRKKGKRSRMVSRQEAVADNRGAWQVVLPAAEAGTGYELTLAAPEKELRFRDVALGEVWLCSGQSNMEFMLKQSAEYAALDTALSDPELRLFDQKARWTTNSRPWPEQAADSVNHLKYFRSTEWAVCRETVARDFSAIGYFFGKMLRDSLKVPVGIICNAVGGSGTEAWIDRGTLEQSLPQILVNWTSNDFIQPWVRGRALQNMGGDQSPIKRHPYEPCYLFESSVLPMQRYPIRGVLWYQGESNAHNVEAHELLFPLLVKSWRTYWQDEHLPFYYVQLSSLNRPSWPWFRDSQRRLMHEIPYTGMAVSSDRGDSLDVHPRRKQDIGQRLGRWALNRTYQHSVVPSGPLYRSAVREGNQVVVSFDYAEGLRVGAQGQEQLAPGSFELAEYEGLYYPAQCRIQDGQVVLWSDQVDRPRYVRYGWQPFTRANLYNAAGLPASTFRAEVAGQ